MTTFNFPSVFVRRRIRKYPSSIPTFWATQNYEQAGKTWNIVEECLTFIRNTVYLFGREVEIID